MLSERMMLKEVVLDVQNKIGIQNGEIVKINKLNQDKTDLINLQSQQIADFNSLYGLAEKNISLLKDEVKFQKKKKFKTMIISITATALVTSTGILLLKP
jgi:hypothetical protein